MKWFSASTVGMMACLLASISAASANPFGTGIPVEPVPGFGFQALIAWTAAAQGSFYEGLTGALRQVATSPEALWLLLGLSFAYGVVHAAGPGHGKVVIGSYMLASKETARRGAFLAVGAALLQATMAVAVVGLLAGVFGLTRQVLSEVTISLERFSYVLIVMLGGYLMVKAARRVLSLKTVVVPTPQLVHAHAAHGHQHHSHSHDHHHHDGHHHHDECGCGHSHIPDADALDRTGRSLGQTAALILGAGARPCTGALLVLVLALSQGLFWQGAAAAYAMGVGTALTVGIMAVLASGLSGAFSHFNGAHSGTMAYAPQALAVLGSLMIMGFGLLLLAASLAR
ncbi:MAG: nickel transporter [Pseudomonadota bacterium]